MAMTGHVDQISRSLVEGWAFDPGRAGEPVSVSVFVNGAHHGVCLAIHPRADLTASAGGPPPGASGFRFEFDPPLSAFVAHRIEVRETWSGDILPQGSRIVPRPAFQNDDRGLRPVVLTSVGRSGTTLLMSEFATHPDIVVGDCYPYEIKQIAYHAAAFRALVADADRERSTNPDTMLSIETNRLVGANPYNCPGLFGLARPAARLRDFYEDKVPVGYAALFRRIITEYYTILAGSQRKYAASLFCEKGDINTAARQGARLFFNQVKEIVVVRDPRDLLCSSIAFWKLEPGEALAMLRTTIPKLARIASAAAADTFVVRYEDVVLDAVATRLAIAGFLGLNPMGRSVSGDNTVPRGHQTSGDPAASVGRWKRDLSPALADACDEAFAPFMRDFDYAPSGGGEIWPRSRGADEWRSDPGAENHASPAACPPAGHQSQILAAEGQVAVSAMLAEWNENQHGESPSPTVLDLVFGQDEIGMGFTRDGWSNPESGYVWTNARESTLLLPPILGGGAYRLALLAAPFIHETALPAQLVSVLIGGLEVGTARLSDISVMEIEVPASVIRSRQAVTVTLRLPDAARPSELNRADDNRLLGVSLRRVTLSRVSGARPTPESSSPWTERLSRPESVADSMAETVRRIASALGGEPDARPRAACELSEVPALVEAGGGD